MRLGVGVTVALRTGLGVGVTELTWLWRWMSFDEFQIKDNGSAEKGMIRVARNIAGVASFICKLTFGRVVSKGVQVFTYR